MYTLGSLPQGLDEIVIGSADRVKTTSPKVVFAVGVNDGLFPMIPAADGILSDNERKTLAAHDLQEKLWLTANSYFASDSIV
jgi:ATP-dependent helicase/nuclease subunit B